ncbi:hypothetical protein AKJ45_02360 [candidate division MSBL1 archaeon SCGC-AAA261F19]|uniref:Uncharacterized protein n=2 Tax=candidate division MSBL1 TaxID=215777 RepID=A0A133V9M7_9EURY|nr:hypothetical protein AKJ43_03610 [candidate division MSBL1 archaeon SCGC-AAA261D19]KXB03153.1 hypothetical protein AKJ45_02360 [candidate division MSBL1 archaeon SCGC-AAA261F19]
MDEYRFVNIGFFDKSSFRGVTHLNGNINFKGKIVESEVEIIKFSNKGYDCQPLGNEKWLMKKEIDKANLMLDIDNETCLVKELCYSKEN